MLASSSKKKIFALLGATFFTLTLGLIMVQERLIFFPEKLNPEYSFSFKGAVEKNFEFEGDKVNSLLFPQEGATTVILYFHGNAGSLSTWGLVGEELRNHLKQSVWILDYPGFGKSEGVISSERQLLDLAEAFYAQAQALYPKLKVVVYGRSIGSGPAAWLASKHKLPLILETPYSSFSKLASQLAPWFPSFLRRYSFRVDEWLKDFKEPLLLIHGTRDEVIPYSHSLELKEIAKESHYLEILNGIHNNLSTHVEYWVGIGEYLQRLDKK